MANSLKLYVDPNNANLSRLSRLPNAMRFNSRQELYTLNVGAKTWQDFEAEINAEAVGQECLSDRCGLGINDDQSSFFLNGNGGLSIWSSEVYLSILEEISIKK